MRNTIVALLAGPMLFGCLSQETAFTGDADGDLTVAKSGNSTPTITGNPSSAIKYSESYQFKPSASDADGDALTFSVKNRPSWANFESGTGELYGLPSLGDVGVYENIQISVSDGKSTSALRAFTVTVSQSALGSVTLSWVAPTQNSDGSPLMDLAGYKIYFRNESGGYSDNIRIDNPGLTTYVVDQLTPATYYFAATAFNASGIESSFSSEVVRMVN